MTIKWINRVKVAVALAGFSFVMSVQAQDADAKDALAIQEIVVVAQKRAQSLEDVPVVVSVLSSDFIEDAGIVGLEDLQNYVPSLVLERNTNPFATTIRIRGIGNLGNIPNFEPAVGMFVDGAFRSRTGIGMGDLVDIDRIEILHGPQSTLYGKNVTAGAVSVITKRPTDEFEAMLEANGGSDGELGFKGFINGSLGETVSVRVSALNRTRDGTTYDTGRQLYTNEVDQTAIRGQILIEPNDRLSILAILGYADKGDNLKCCAPDSLYGPVSGAFVGALTGQPLLDTDPTNRVIQHNDDYVFSGDASEATLSIQYDFDAVTLNSLTSFDTYDMQAAIDAEQTALDVWVFTDRQEGDTFSQELRLTSSTDGSFEWMAGVYYYDNEFTRGSLDSSEPLVVLGPHVVPIPTTPGTAGDAAFFLGKTDTKNASIFGQGTFHLTDKFSITAGARWFDEEKSFSVDSIASLAAFPSLALAGTVPGPLSDKRSTDGLAWNLNAQLFATDDVMLYASASKGIKGGGFNADWGALTVDQRRFEDEEVLSYELGLKASFFDRRVTFNAAVFQSDYDNFQNASFLGVAFLIRNAEDVSTQGFEIDSTAVLASWLTMNVAATFVDAEYNSFTNGPCYFGRTPDNPAEGTCVLDGEGLPSAPDSRITLGALMHWEVGSGELYARADSIWSDDVQTNTSLDPRSMQSSYSLLNGRIGWRNDRLDISASVHNATDENVILVSGAQTLIGGVDGGLQNFLNDPRRYGVTLRYNF